MNKRIFQFIIFFVFLSLLVLPAINSEFHIIEIKEVNENRNKAKKPSGHLLAEIFYNEKYVRDIENYYNDHFGLRDILIRFKNQFDYSLFKESDEVYIGNDNYMEYKNVINNEYIHNERMTKEDNQKLYSKLVDMRKKFAAKDIELFIMICPQKSSVFPELFPKNPVRRPEQTSYDRLINYLTNTKEFHGCILDVKQVLLKAAQLAPVYPRTDFHWNEYGSASVAKAFLNLMCSKMNIENTWDSEINIDEVPDFSGGINSSLSIFNDITEINYENIQDFEVLAPYVPLASKLIGGSWKNTSDKELLPPIVIIGDSYTSHHFEHSGFYNYFEESTWFLSQNTERISLPSSTKIVVIEFIEAHISVILERLNNYLPLD